MSCVMRKLAFCICKNKGADQLCGNGSADQHLCFRNTSKFSKSEMKSLIIFCGCTAWNVLNLIGNPEGRFSHEVAHMSCIMSIP